MADELVSIIMPAKNAALYIEDCLNSILKQRYTNYELIVVNDNSSDSTLQLLQSYTHCFTRLLVLNNRGLGIIDALNTAYPHVKGDFITRMDADDIMPPLKLELLHKELLGHGRGHVATGLVQYFKEGVLGDGYKKYENWLNHLCKSASHFQEIYKECVIPSPCWMMYKEDFDAIGAFDSTVYPEDYDLAFRMYQGGMKVLGVKETCHLWRDHGQRASRNDENYADNNFLDLKLKYFLKLDYDPTCNLVLWGAGRKGKYLAKQLLDANIEFRWTCDNPNKIGHDIYGKLLQAAETDYLESNSQIIVAVANAEEQKKIKALIRNEKAFYFC